MLEDVFCAGNFSVHGVIAGKVLVPCSKIAGGSSFSLASPARYSRIFPCADPVIEVKTFNVCILRKRLCESILTDYDLDSGGLGPTIAFSKVVIFDEVFDFKADRFNVNSVICEPSTTFTSKELFCFLGLIAWFFNIEDHRSVGLIGSLFKCSNFLVSVFPVLLVTVGFPVRTVKRALPKVTTDEEETSHYRQHLCHILDFVHAPNASTQAEAVA